MKNNKLSSYTVSELLVVLVISGLLISSISQSYFLVNQFQNKLSDKFLTISDFERMRWLIKQDFQKSNLILVEEDEIICIIGNNRIFYDLSNQFLKRIQNGMVEEFRFDIIATDQLFISDLHPPVLQKLELRFYFKGEELMLSFWKDYDAVSIINAMRFR